VWRKAKTLAKTDNGLRKREICASMDENFRVCKLLLACKHSTLAPRVHHYTMTSLQFWF
jgi:hypothetical protein